MPELPTGTVTFLFTDLEGSTRLWEEHPDAMRDALARHDEILRETVEKHSGHVVKTTGDGLHAAFGTAHDAVLAAVDAQRGLAEERWRLPEPLRVRMGIHTGEAEVRDGDYYGTAVNRAARLAAAAHGGQIVASHATEEVARDHLGTDISLRDLGDHRLRDLSRPERVFKIDAPGLAADFPALRSLDEIPGNLPLQLTSFVGRTDEIRALASALDETRLVTLTGVGGVGKTRLAIQVAAEVAHRFSDGAWLCELAAATDAESLVQVVASTLGVASRPGVTLELSIREFLRTRQVLVVLDNCEHLLTPAAALAEGLLRDCSGVRILATSREGLAVVGEQVWPLRSLGLVDSGGSHEVAGSDAVTLFVERARTARPSFDLDAQNLEAVAEICRRLDGIPLAIELAAARVAALRPAEIASLLDERFRLLTGGRRTAVERHQTLRAAVDWSYSLLADRERLVFERLGVFAGGFDIAAATEVATGDGVEPWDVVDAIGELVAKSMIVADDRPTDTTRYQMLETLRAYARERLDEMGDPDSWRHRHAEHFATVAEQARLELRGADELVCRARLRDEIDNLRAAVGWALDRNGDDAQCGLRIIAALACEAYMNRASGVGAWARRAEPFAERTEPGRRTAVLAAASMDALLGGDYVEGRSLGEQALRDGLPSDCPALHVAHLAIAECDTFSGNHSNALVVMAEARRAVDDVGGDAYSHASIAAAEAAFTAMSGDFDRALPMAEEAVLLARSLGNPSILTVSLFALGFALWDRDPLEALAALDESVALARAGASDMVLAAALSLAARVRARSGDAPAALRGLRDALSAADDVGDRPTFFSALDRAIEILVSAGELERAAVIAGVVTRGPFREMTSLRGGPEEQARARVIEELRERLGASSFDAAVERGAVLTYDKVVDYSVGELDALLAEVATSA